MKQLHLEGSNPVLVVNRRGPHRHKSVPLLVERRGVLAVRALDVGCEEVCDSVSRQGRHVHASSRGIWSWGSAEASHAAANMNSVENAAATSAGTETAKLSPHIVTTLNAPPAAPAPTFDAI